MSLSPWLPDLNNAQRFLRGASASGGMGGNDSHTHQMQDLDGDHGHFTSVNNSSNDVTVLVPGTYATQSDSSLPSYYEELADAHVRDGNENYAHHHSTRAVPRKQARHAGPRLR